MPEKHQMFANPNNALKIIGTARDRVISMSSFPLH